MALDSPAILPCGPEQLSRILALEQEALARMERPDLLRRNTVEMWQECLRPPHLCLGAWVAGALDALAVLYVPERGGAEDLSALLTQMDAAPLAAANFKVCIVSPQWRGRGWQVLLGTHLQHIAEERGFNLLCATASPHNGASVHNLRKLGYQPDHLLQKYGYERMLFYRLAKPKASTDNHFTP